MTRDAKNEEALVAVMVRRDEATLLSNPARCDGCGHLMVLHNLHCCEYCLVARCRCRRGSTTAAQPEGTPEPEAEPARITSLEEYRAGRTT